MMNDESKRGFQLFAQNQGARLSGNIRVASYHQELVHVWTTMESNERDKWEERALKLAAALQESPTKLKKVKRSRKKKRQVEIPRLEEESHHHELDDEDDLGTLTAQLADDEMDDFLQRKYVKDRQEIEEAIMAQTGGCGEKIKRLRFLLGSVQTFGNTDDSCLMAEFAMNEFNLRDGVVDRFSTLVGPWTVENQIKRSRAIFHANETHRIPLNVNCGQLTMRELMVEILGRTEPAIAAKQGIRVGLYKGDNEDQEERLNRIFMDGKNMYHIVDQYNRRFIICLRQEYQYMMASMAHLKETVGLLYDGFPCSADRFVLADAFVDAVSDCLGGEPVPDTSKWLAALGTRMPENFATPWERNGELFCARHRNERNSCCATVTASRASFIILYSLEDLLKRL